MNANDKATLLTVRICASILCNILEDIYIETRMCEFHPGIFKQGIQLNNLRMMEQATSIQEQVDKGIQEFSIMANLILQYCRSGTVNDLTHYNGPYLDLLEDCIPYIEDSIYSDDITERFVATNHLLVLLWEYIKPLIEKMQKKQDSSDENETNNTLSELLEKEIETHAPLPSGRGGNLPSQAQKGKAEQKSTSLAHGTNQSRSKQITQALDVINEDENRMALTKTDTILDGNNPGITYNHQYTGSGYKKAASDLFHILNDLASQKAEARFEQELTEELQTAANDIHYGNAHTGIHVNINRICYIPDSYISDYEKIAPPLLRASKRLQCSIVPLLKAESEGGKMKNLQFGKRLDMRSLYHTDGTYFVRTRLPMEEAKLAVGLLIDESGSMADAHRITHAKKMAIVLYDFCKSLQIPIMIYGHSTSGDGVELFSYAEYDSIGNNDCYRLMDMSARGGNRDGAALRFVAEQLSNRSESQKLLIIISDGQPAAYGYYGTEAEADLRGIKREYEKKGITLFAAAIGADKENIKRIYKNGFLDITNLEDLPKNMTLLVRQYLK